MTGWLEDIAIDGAAVSPEERTYASLTNAVRSIIDAAIRTTVDTETLTEATAELQRIAAMLQARQIGGSFGVELREPGQSGWANGVVGVRNAIAPPLVLQYGADGTVWSDFDLGAAYEGPPGLVHGGIAALILDEILGQTVRATGQWGLTGTLTLRYLGPTPLGRLRAEGSISRLDGRKAFVTGTLSHGGEATVEATGIFIFPTIEPGGSDQSRPPRATN